MGTINQPKPSDPKSPQPDAPPLQPGQPQDSRSTSGDPKRVNQQTADEQEQKGRLNR